MIFRKLRCSQKKNERCFLILLHPKQFLFKRQKVDYGRVGIGFLKLGPRSQQVLAIFSPVFWPRGRTSVNRRTFVFIAFLPFVSMYCVLFVPHNIFVGSFAFTPKAEANGARCIVWTASSCFLLLSDSMIEISTWWMNALLKGGEDFSIFLPRRIGQGTSVSDNGRDPQ